MTYRHTDSTAKLAKYFTHLATMNFHVSEGTRGGADLLIINDELGTEQQRIGAQPSNELAHPYSHTHLALGATPLSIDSTQELLKDDIYLSTPTSITIR